MSTIITVENLSKRYLIGHQRQEGYSTLRDLLTSGAKRALNKLVSPAKGGANQSIEEFWALKDVSFEVQQGDRVGIIGRNGAGKSTLLKILSRITEPTDGRIKLSGRVASLLEIGTGFHPELTGRENIYLNGAILGMSKLEIKRRFDEIVAFAEVERFLDTPVKRYSSGMYVRLAFSVAAHLEPEILVVDEVLAVGDAQFQKKCLGKMEQVGVEGRTVIFVSHNMGTIKALCNKAILLEGKTKKCEGDVSSVIDTYFSRDGDETAVVKWDLPVAPRIGSASLAEVGVLNDGKQVGPDLSTEMPIQIYIKFIVREEARIGTTVNLYNSEGSLIFSSLSNHEPNWHGKVRPRGLYKSTCEIPANFLAEGAYSIAIAFWEGAYESGIVENDLLRIVARAKGLVRGDLPYEIRRVLTLPLFKWYSSSEGERES